MISCLLLLFHRGIVGIGVVRLILQVSGCGLFRFGLLVFGRGFLKLVVAQLNFRRGVSFEFDSEQLGQRDRYEKEAFQFIRLFESESVF